MKPIQLPTRLTWKNLLRDTVVRKSAKKEQVSDLRHLERTSMIERIVKDAYESPFSKKLTTLAIVSTFLSVVAVFSLGGVGIWNGLLLALPVFTLFILVPYAIGHLRRQKRQKLASNEVLQKQERPHL